MITELVGCFVRIVRNRKLCRSELLWKI